MSELKESQSISFFDPFSDGAPDASLQPVSGAACLRETFFCLEEDQPGARAAAAGREQLFDIGGPSTPDNDRVDDDLLAAGEQAAALEGEALEAQVREQDWFDQLSLELAAGQEAMGQAETETEQADAEEATGFFDAGEQPEVDDLPMPAPEEEAPTEVLEDPTAKPLSLSQKDMNQASRDFDRANLNNKIFNTWTFDTYYRH